MKTIREIFGYTLGGVLFVGLLPFLMWLASLKPALWSVSIAQIIIAPVFIIIGLALSVWTIIYMRHKGDGNPIFVAFVAIMSFQVISEEKRLLRDFGQEYEDYKKKVGRYL